MLFSTCLTDASNTFLRLMKGITGLFTDSVDDSVCYSSVFYWYSVTVFSFASVLEVGIARFFMESRLYPKTSFYVRFFLFKRKRYFSIVKGMFRRELYLFFGVLRLLGSNQVLFVPFCAIFISRGGKIFLRKKQFYYLDR